MGRPCLTCPSVGVWCPCPVSVALSVSTHCPQGVCSQVPHHLSLDLNWVWAAVSPRHPLLTCVSYSLVCWPSSEGTLNWPDLLSDPSIVGNTLQRLVRGQMGHVLGAEDDGLSLVSPSLPTKYFSASGEQGWGGWSSSIAQEGPQSKVWGGRNPCTPDKSCSPDEDLIRQILAEGASSLVPTQNTQAETDLLPGL